MTIIPLGDPEGSPGISSCIALILALVIVALMVPSTPNQSLDYPDALHPRQFERGLYMLETMAQGPVLKNEETCLQLKLCF
mmetsp:Transcript_3711/g.6557  ORF Transcript_3711/g.6557 Transcript_3711/m.6557 type:complete len:81 (+) Transcript_3711:784-1026(+)